jgi:ADP-ribose pyrophosphatase YjhB (NUDIX family)
MEKNFELIVRALIIYDNKILVCQTRGRDYFFLPGGHVEFGENMRYSLARELNEEIGAKIINSQFIGGVENLFEQDGLQKHEVSFVFLTEIDMKEIVSREEHVEFFWFTMDEFVEKNIVPPALKDAVLQWTAEKEIFFIEERAGNF